MRGECVNLRYLGFHGVSVHIYAHALSGASRALMASKAAAVADWTWNPSFYGRMTAFTGGTRITIKR